MMWGQMNFWSVQAGEQFYPTDTRACRLANLANVLDSVIEHYLRARNCVFVGSLVYGRGYDAGSIVPTEKDVSEILTA